MKKNKKCAVCDKKLKYVLNLGNHPCADTFLKNKKASISLRKYPLSVGFCGCNHLTAINHVSPFERYEKNDYSYTSNNSPVSRNHFYKIAKKIIKNVKLKEKNSVIEIGSNDGTFLKNIKKFSNANVLGIDPSTYMCNLAPRHSQLCTRAILSTNACETFIPFVCVSASCAHLPSRICAAAP